MHNSWPEFTGGAFFSPRMLALKEVFAFPSATTDNAEWWALHSQLHDELQCLPWEWPCIAAPDEPPYHPTQRGGTLSAK